MPRSDASAPSVPARPPTPAEVAEQTRRFAAILVKRNRERLRAAVQAMVKPLDRAATAPQRPVACAAGCNHCCHMLVSATAPELFIIAEHLSSLPAARRAALERAVVQADAETAGLSGAERAQLARPCPMLVDGLCAVYPVRPVTCRSYASFDRNACEQARRHPQEGVAIPVPKAAMALRRFLLYCFRAGLAKRGLDGNSYEFVGGLRRVLETPGAEARWLAGEDVFAGIQVTAGPPGD